MSSISRATDARPADGFRDPARSDPRWWVTLAAVVFALNLVWESAHGGVLYSHNPPGWRLLQATGGDVLYILGAVAVSLPCRRRSARLHLSVLGALLTVLAITIELHALATGRWGYAPAMATIGGVGVSPLVQLPVTGLLSLGVTERAPMWARRWFRIS